jgi:flagellar basal-body rod protein FlgB
MLDATAVRHQSIATNLANTNTPGYKRIDLSSAFEQELRNSIQNQSLKQGEPPRPVVAQDQTVTYSRADGNNVQIDREVSSLAANATNYNALSQFVSGSLRQLKMAITGRSA